MDPKFLKAVQDKGWHITSVTEDEVIVKCPAVGCGLFAAISERGHIPGVDPGRQRDRIDRKVETYDDIREILRDRREGLSLTIREVEDLAGFAQDHLAKMEKDNPSKTPNVQHVIEWAQALGFEMVFRPTEMTPYAIRTICETRAQVERRTNRFTIESRRRGKA
ncbi:hypothetical protein GCM10011360_17700 [Primorskyibacter flagellatus]|uniref:Uncharacterized protein n=1 Tax=Primorskyibacter flagellatus TaxID=1387277 RepID=A0A917A617_9RHOB|nr:helix-turn-helix transcriptional regulator [Primorskyibacter flagellatus]GGE30088.1 hypothetical protein GCM10011360_17700 [Primorskyibacter flagellatus]